jgi:uncharacterized protein (DUF2252 family)
LNENPGMTVEERSALGRAARTVAPRSGQASLDVSARDAVAILQEQDASRVPELLPIRYGRMLASPLAFYRGAAAVMAADLAQLPHTSLNAQLSGDAHLLNFGGFASPERDLLFDLNDFDETHRGPFEWDVKRLATSIEIAGRHRDIGGRERTGAVVSTVRAYRTAIREFAAQGDLDVWYARLDAQELLDALRTEHDPKLVQTLQATIEKARSNDGRRALKTLTRRVDGEPRIVSEPPLIVPASELPDGVEDTVRAVLGRYPTSLVSDRRVLFERFRYVDLALKVVGIGSVGTRCWIVLMLGRDENDPLFLQLKEAKDARGVVEGQRVMQAASDIFLGWAHGDHDFYVRQLRDWKVSLDVEAILPRGLAYYAEACAWTLARAHARSGDRIATAAYLGSSARFDEAIARFAAAYADQNERDHAALQRAVADGRVQAVEGI